MNEESIKREENSLRIQVSVSIVRQMGFEIPLQENVSAGVHGGRPSKDSDNYQQRSITLSEITRSLNDTDGFVPLVITAE